MTQGRGDPPGEGWDIKTAKLAACLRLLIDLEREAKNGGAAAAPAGDDDLGDAQPTS